MKLFQNNKNILIRMLNISLYFFVIIIDYF